MSKIPNFEMFNFEKQRPVSDVECPQESKKKSRLNDVTIRGHVEI